MRDMDSVKNARILYLLAEMFVMSMLMSPAMRCSASG